MSEVTLNPLECALDEAQAFRRQVDALQVENDRLRGLINELLITLLRSGYDIEASWDRLRKVLCSDRACKVEVENAELRKLLLDVWNDAIRFDGFWDYVTDDGEIYNEDELPHYQERMRKLGIEVN